MLGIQDDGFPVRAIGDERHVHAIAAIIHRGGIAAGHKEAAVPVATPRAFHVCLQGLSVRRLRQEMRNDIDRVRAVTVADVHGQGKADAVKHRFVDLHGYVVVFVGFMNTQIWPT